LKESCDIRIHYEDMQRCEVQALFKLEWDLFRVIPLDFLHTYELVVGYLVPDDKLFVREHTTRGFKTDLSSDTSRKSTDEHLDREEVALRIKASVSTISDIVMRNHFDFLGYTPSVVALAIIESARGLCEVHENPSYLRHFPLDLKSLNTCKQTLQRLLKECKLSSASSSEMDMAPSERSKGPPILVNIEKQLT
jgi:hypothetical protein